MEPNPLQFLSYHYATKNLRGAFIVGLWQRYQDYKNAFLKEGFSPRGLHEHLALLLEHHHYSWLMDLMVSYHSATLQL